MLNRFECGCIRSGWPVSFFFFFFFFFLFLLGGYFARCTSVLRYSLFFLLLFFFFCLGDSWEVRFFFLFPPSFWHSNSACLSFCCCCCCCCWTDFFFFPLNGSHVLPRRKWRRPKNGNPIDVLTWFKKKKKEKRTIFRHQKAIRVLSLFCSLTYIYIYIYIRLLLLALTADTLVPQVSPLFSPFSRCESLYSGITSYAHRFIILFFFLLLFHPMFTCWWVFVCLFFPLLVSSVS